jgi:AraC-like DNA-binding protein
MNTHQPPFHQPTVTLQFAQAIRQAAARLGISLPPSEGADGRVSLESQDELWDAFCAASDDALIGLRLGLELQAGHLDMTGLLLMSCDHYGESLDALLDYYPIVGEGGDFSLQQHPEEISLHYTAHYKVRAAQRIEAVMAALLNLSHWNTGGHFRALRLEFSHAPVDEPDRYQQLLGCPVRFQQPHNRICFAPDMLALPLVQANASMRNQLRRLADEQLTVLGQDSFSHQVASLVQRHPRQGKEKIAAELAMSGRHLTRRLANEGLTFKQIRDRELLKLAQTALADNARIADIALQLGFSDESAFAKAFRRWTGQSPARFRDQPS